MMWTKTNKIEKRGSFLYRLCMRTCGSSKFVREYDLLSGASTRCHRCARKESRPGRRIVKHVDHKLSAKLRGAVRNAITRCTDKTCRQYNDYGGRGIKVCDLWLTNPHLFVEYIATLDGHDNVQLVLDRIDNNGHYEPGNIRFVNMVESARNRRVRRDSRCPQC